MLLRIAPPPSLHLWPFPRVLFSTELFRFLYQSMDLGAILRFEGRLHCRKSFALRELFFPGASLLWDVLTAASHQLPRKVLPPPRLPSRWNTHFAAP
jgi:hypothetical protein